jgi:hypothetical protein
MALVPCPECGHQVSTQAAACPSCGRTLAANVPGLVAPSGVAAGPEQPLWQGHPSYLLMLGRLVRFGLWLVLLSAVGYGLLGYALPFLARNMAPVRRFDWTHHSTIVLVVYGLVGALLLLKAVGLALTLLRVKATHYRVTNQRIVIETGLLSKALEDIDLRTIDDLEFQQSVIERLVGIGRVIVVSSDKLAPKLVLRGIHDPRGVRELIRSHAYQATQRQLFTRST